MRRHEWTHKKERRSDGASNRRQACCILELCCRAVAPGDIAVALLNAFTGLAIVFAICVAAIPKGRSSRMAKKSRDS